MKNKTNRKLNEIEKHFFEKNGNNIERVGGNPGQGSEIAGTRVSENWTSRRPVSASESFLLAMKSSCPKITSFARRKL